MSGRWPTQIFYVAMVALATIKVYAIYGTSPVQANNFDEFQQTANLSLLDVNFWWFAPRPFVVPLIHKIFADRFLWLMWFQTAISVFAWSLLAYQTMFLFRELRGAIFVYTCILAMALSSSVMSWDGLLSSESLSISFVVISIALAIRFFQGPSFFSSAYLIVTSLLCVFTRDTNAVFVICLGGFMLIATRMPPGFHARIAVSGMIFVVLLSQANIQASHRYYVPMIDSFLVRVLPYEQRREYFEEQEHMPAGQDVMAFAGKSHMRINFSRLPRPFLGWVNVRGCSAYARYLLTHPFEAIREAASETYLGYRYHRPESKQRSFEDVEAPLSRFIAAHSMLLLSFMLAAVYLGRKTAVGPMVLFLAVAAGAQAFVCYYGDPLDLRRHAVLVEILFRLGLIVSIAQLSERRAPAGVPASFSERTLIANGKLS